jgi:circadian clock protein KaiC
VFFGERASGKEVRLSTRAMSSGIGTARVSSGIEGLDDVLGGGFPPGQCLLIEGVPGSGKTTLGLQFLIAGARLGEEVLYVTLSESRIEIEKVAHSHNWSLDGITILECIPTEDMLRPEDQYSVFHPSEIEFQDVTQTILKKLEEIQPRRIVLDSVSGIRILARDSTRYRRQILALKHFFGTRNCTVLLLDDRSSCMEDMQLQSVVYGVLSLEKLPREFGKTRRRMQVEKMRGSTYREGYHDYNIKTGGLMIYPRLVACEYREPFAEGTVTSAIAGFDSLWDGGINRGSNTLLVGPAGSGKSSIAMSYAVAAARRGEHASVFLFEEWLQTACKRAARLNIDPGPHIESGMLHLEQIDPAELSPGEFVQHVRDTVERRAAKVVVIDSLNGFVNAMPGERYLIMQMHELLAFLNQHGVASLLVLAQPGPMGPMNSPLDLSYLADNILVFRFFEAEGKLHKAVSVMKKRGGAHEDTIRKLTLAEGRIAVGPPLREFRGVLTGVPTYVGSGPMLSGAEDDR